jgi:hypothetical protein
MDAHTWWNVQYTTAAFVVFYVAAVGWVFVETLLAVRSIIRRLFDDRP